MRVLTRARAPPEVWQSRPASRTQLNKASHAWLSAMVYHRTQHTRFSPVLVWFGSFDQHSDEERRFMYKINQGHLTVFCIVFVGLGGPPSPVRITYNPGSVVYVLKPARAIWRYLLSEFCALLCCSLSQLN
jgi:hypothetical protein